MKRPEWPTLLTLIVLGFILVALPLVAALVVAIAQVNQLARDSGTQLIALQASTVASRTLVERANAMERSARQFEAVRDAAFEALYEEHRGAVLEVLDQLEAGAGNSEMAGAAAGVRRHVDGVQQQLESVGDAEAFQQALAGLRDSVAELARQQNALARDMAAQFPEHAQQLQALLTGLAVLVIPVSITLSAVLFLVIAPPLRRTRRAIQALGRGALGEPIEVGGPRDLAELGVRLEWLRQRLVELEAQKSQFLRNVSHELKTPLTNIREGTELLLEDEAIAGRAEARQVAGIVRANGLRLQQMIETLLRHGAEGDLAAGQPFQELQLDALLRQVLERYTLAAAGRGVRIRAEIEAVRCKGGAKRLEVIMDNLLSNALKYTPPRGHIEVRLSRRDGAIVLDVQDDGPGVPVADRARIFDWFFTGPRPPGSIVAGTGMGLAIAQEYAEQHGGMIALVPSAGGAHFQLTIGTPPR